VLTIFFLIVLPLTIRRLDKTWRVAKRDVILSSTWIACATVGTFIVLLAPNLATAIVGFIIATLGYAMPISLRSFLASHFEKSFSGRLFAGITIVETIGGLIGQPLMMAGYYTQGVPFVISVVRNDYLQTQRQADMKLGNVPDYAWITCQTSNQNLML
jgi:MFS family permease